MTVETSTRKQTFAGGQDTLTFTFKTLPDYPDYIKAKKTLISTGEDTDLTYDSDYTVAVESDGVGGVVTMTPSVSTLYTVTVYRETSDIQESDYDDYSQFPADTVEEDFDRRTLISQEYDETLDRTLKLSITSTLSSLTLPNPIAGNFLAWNSSGTGIANSNVASQGGLVLSTETSLGTDDTIAVSQKAIKTYVDASTLSTLSIAVTNSTQAAQILQAGSGSGLVIGSYANMATGKSALNIYNLGSQTISPLIQVTQGGVASSTATINIDNLSVGDGIKLTQTGVLAASKYGLYIYSNGAQANSNLVYIHQDNAASSAHVMKIINDGASSALYIDQNNNSSAIEVDNGGNSNGIYINQTAVLTSGSSALYVYSNAVQNQGALLTVKQDNSSSSTTCLQCTSDGSQYAAILQRTDGGSSNEVLYIYGGGTYNWIATNAGAVTQAKLTSSGVWTDGSSMKEDKENLEEAVISGFVDKLKNLKLFTYQKKWEVYGGMEPDGDKKLPNGKPKMKYKSVKVNPNAKYYTSFCLDDATTPEDLIPRDMNTGEIDGVSPQLGVNFLLGVCKELIVKIENLEDRISALET